MLNLFLHIIMSLVILGSIIALYAFESDIK